MGPFYIGKEAEAPEMRELAQMTQSVSGGVGSERLEKPARSDRYPVGFGKVSPCVRCQVTVTYWGTAANKGWHFVISGCL